MASQQIVGQFRQGEVVSGTSYRVLELVGSGGMGSVYRVEHQELGRKFVLKALHGHLASRKDLQARLRNEWRALGKLEHPNIVQVTDAGQTEEGLPYYVMENLRGVTLGKLLHERKKLAPVQACRIAADILSGLHAAHETGAIHRDIKPPNIFVSEEGGTKLLDFGIAKLRDQSAKVVTAGGVSIGTPRYMAPEQASGTDVDGRADIYATALVLYEMVVGRGPFSTIRDPNELVMAHMGQEPERADFLDPSVPEELADLIQRWLSKSPDSRPATADFARREIVALAESLPADADPAAEEPTLGGDYDASTVGGPGHLEEEPRGVVASGPEVSVDDLATTLERPGSQEPTSTLSVSASPDNRDVLGTANAVLGPAGTLGWGTTQKSVGTKTSGLQASVEPGLGREELRRRPSMTPPPVSSLRNGRVSGRRTTLKWIAATATVSFVVALGVSRMLAPRDEEAPAERVATSPASDHLPNDVPKGPSEPADKVLTDVPAIPPAPEPGAPLPKAMESEVTAEGPAREAPASKNSEPADPPSVPPRSTEAKESSTVSAKAAARPAPQPSQPRPHSAPPPSELENLPKSGLW